MQSIDQLRDQIAKRLCTEVAGDTWDEADPFHARKARFYREEADEVMAMVSEAQRVSNQRAA